MYARTPEYRGKVGGDGETGSYETGNESSNEDSEVETRIDFQLSSEKSDVKFFLYYDPR